MEKTANYTVDTADKIKVAAATMAADDAISVSALKRSFACDSAKKYQYDAKDGETTEAIKRSAIVKETIVNALKHNVRAMTKVYKAPGIIDVPASEHEYSKAIMEYMSTRFVECGFINYQQQQEQLLWDHRRVMRYLLWEKRIPSFPEPGTVKIGGYTFRVHPSYAFVTNADTVELVFIRNSKPTISNRSKSDGFERDMQLYAAILYGRQLGYKNITASIYFLKKKTDTSLWSGCQQEFNGDNIIRMTDFYNGKPNELDDDMRKYVLTLQDGIPADSMQEKDCQRCPNWDICKYTLPSIATSEADEAAVQESVVKAVSYTAQQQKVVEFNKGVARVIAAAGSGKTQTVAGRVVKLLKDGVKPEEILCITFSNAGANEMKRKIAKECLIQKVSVDLEALKVTTFHAFEFDIAKANWKELGYGRQLTVIDTVQRFSIINQILKDHPIFEWGGKSFLNYTASVSWGSKGALAIVADVFSQIKALDGDENTPVDQLNFGEQIDHIVKMEIVKRYKYYNQMLHEKGLVDFDDMELNAFRIIDNNPDYLKNNCAYKHIIIDEFQDTSEFQMELVKRLRRGMPTFESLMIVGDDAQSIYGFRNTSPEYIIEFEKRLNAPFNFRNKVHTCTDATWPSFNDSVVDLYMTSNWRSKQEILDVASNVLELNSDAIDKKIVASRGNGGKVVIQGYKTQDEERKAIAEAIKKEHDNGTAYEDIAVLAYTKSELKNIANELTALGIPSMFGAPEPVSENSRIRALLAFVKVMDNPTNTKSAAIVANAIYRASDLTLTTGIMELSKDEVQERVQKVVDKAMEIQAIINPKEKKDEFIDFIRSFSINDEVVEHFLEALENLNFDEVLKYCKDFERFGLNEEFRRLGDYPGVKLITAHSSKGLEWKVVFVTLDGIAPKFDGRSSEDRQELRRLEFVAITRAREKAFIVGTYMRKSDNSFMTNVPLYEVYRVEDMSEEWQKADKLPSRYLF